MKKLLVMIIMFACAIFMLGESISFAKVLQYKGTDMTVERFIDMCNSGALDDVKAIVALGVDINMRVEHGNTFLMFLAQENLPVAIKTLVAAGADLEARNNAGYTPLMIAIHNDSELAVEALLECGADIHAAKNDGVNVLALAEQKGNKAIIKLLRKAKVKSSSSDIEKVSSQDIHE